MAKAERGSQDEPKTNNIKRYTQDVRDYPAARRKVTLGAEITEWINKEIPE